MTKKQLHKRRSPEWIAWIALQELVSRLLVSVCCLSVLEKPAPKWTVVVIASPSSSRTRRLGVECGILRCTARTDCPFVTLAPAVNPALATAIIPPHRLSLLSGSSGRNKFPNLQTFFAKFLLSAAVLADSAAPATTRIDRRN